MIQGHLQSQKVNFKVKLLKNVILTSIIRSKFNYTFGVILDTESTSNNVFFLFKVIFKVERSISRSNCGNMLFIKYK